ncbi:hypothetical protein IKQ26_07590 [bacterium]|nr:hypothetical protein [bacterium]
MADEIFSTEDNTSGKGKESVVPEVIKKKFNWGACLGTWIWGIGNDSYLTLLIIPAFFLGPFSIFFLIGLPIWFGIKGNEWAWQNRYFDNIAQFNKYQRNWAKIGVAITVVMTIITVLGCIILSYSALLLYFMVPPMLYSR